MNARTRSDDPEAVKVTREIPLPWLIGCVVSLIIHAVMVWVGQQQQGEALKVMAGELRDLRSSIDTGRLDVVELKVKYSDHERRLSALERQPAKP